MSSDYVQNALFGMGKSERQDFLALLRSVGLLDLGQVTYYNFKTNTATVKSFSLVNKCPVVYKDIEVLRMGSNGNGFRHDVTGAMCLIIHPRSTIPDLSTLALNRFKEPYAKETAKCLPLCVRKDEENGLKMGFNNEGAFRISTDNYSVLINEKGLYYTSGDGKVIKSLGGDEDSADVQGAGNIVTTSDSEGMYEVCYWDIDLTKLYYRMRFKADGTWTEQRVAQEAMTAAQLDDKDTYLDFVWTDEYSNTGEHKRELRDGSGSDGTDAKVIRSVTEGVDGSITRVLNNSDEKVLWTFSEAADGSITRVLNNSDEKVLLEVNIAATGAVTITQTNADGDVLNNIAIADTGDVTVEQTKAENTITLKQDGTLSVKTKGAISVESEDAVTIKGTKVTLDSDVEIKKTLKVTGDTTLAKLTQSGEASLGG